MECPATDFVYELKAGKPSDSDYHVRAFRPAWDMGHSMAQEAHPGTGIAKTVFAPGFEHLLPSAGQSAKRPLQDADAAPGPQTPKRQATAPLADAAPDTGGARAPALVDGARAPTLVGGAPLVDGGAGRALDVATVNNNRSDGDDDDGGDADEEDDVPVAVSDSPKSASSADNLVAALMEHATCLVCNELCKHPVTLSCTHSFW